ncbi:hypothetical protein DMUE_1995 [Dictyocoela muelleri]|nr:hypothetical protein DMUE_1995 [Dictyocoela muelleri]
MTDENLKNIQRAIDEIWDGYNNSVQHDLKKILGVNNLENKNEVKKQYARRILLVHSDKFSSIESKIDFHGQEHDFFFKILNRAKEIAFDSSLLGKYDQLCFVYRNKRIDLFTFEIKENFTFNKYKFSNETRFDNGKYAPGFRNTGNNSEGTNPNYFNESAKSSKFSAGNQKNYNFYPDYDTHFTHNFDKDNYSHYKKPDNSKEISIFISIIIILLIIRIIIKIIKRRENRNI